MAKRIDRARADVDQLKATVQPTGTADLTPTPAEFRAKLLIDADGAAIPFKPDLSALRGMPADMYVEMFGALPDGDVGLGPGLGPEWYRLG